MLVVFSILLIRHSPSSNGSSRGANKVTDATSTLAYSVSVNESHGIDTERGSKVLTVLVLVNRTLNGGHRGGQASALTSTKESEPATTKGTMDPLNRGKEGEAWQNVHGGSAPRLIDTSGKVRPVSPRDTQASCEEIKARPPPTAYAKPVGGQARLDSASNSEGGRRRGDVQGDGTQALRRLSPVVIHFSNRSGWFIQTDLPFHLYISETRGGRPRRIYPCPARHSPL